VKRALIAGGILVGIAVGVLGLAALSIPWGDYPAAPDMSWRRS
jgi:hypothetical protein